MTDLLKPITRQWMEKARLAEKHKKSEFGRDAEECMSFFDGPHDFMYGSEYVSRSGGASADMPSPTFRMTTNKVAEVVQLFGPALYYRNPHRQVTPKRRRRLNLPPSNQGAPSGMPPMNVGMDPAMGGMMPPGMPPGMDSGMPPDMGGGMPPGMDPGMTGVDPLMAGGMPGMPQPPDPLQMEDDSRNQRIDLVASLMEEYLNYTPNELDLRGHSRMAIDEALITGMGCLWTEVIHSEHSQISMVGSFFDSVDHLLVDPDAETMEDAKWIMRRRVMPKWEVEDRYRLKRGTLKGNLESLSMQGAVSSEDDGDYHRKRGDTNDLHVFYEVYSRMGVGHMLKGVHNIQSNEEVFDQLGQNVYLAVCTELPYPLNVPEEAIENESLEEIFMRVQWPTPFWADPTSKWPVTPIMFHKRPRKLWPMSHIKPGLGELKFINWATSFLADKIKNTSRDFIATLKSAGEEVRTAIMSGKDLTHLEFDKVQGGINDVVQFLQHPPINRDLFEIRNGMMEDLERRLGLNELMYGASRKQMRSAQEASLKGDSTRIRPDDMAECVEHAMTMVARKEAIAARFHLTAQDVAPMLGPMRSQLWEMLVESSDLFEIVTEMDYRIEAGSVRKPNRDRDVENANNAIQTWGPVFQSHAAQTGDYAPLNGLARMWARANDLPEEDFELHPPPPGPSPEEQAMQMEQQVKQQEAAAKQQEAMIKAQMEQQKHQLDVEQAVIKSQIEQQQAAVDLQSEQTKAAADLQNTIMKGRVDQLIAAEKLRQAREMGRIKAEQARKPNG